MAFSKLLSCYPYGLRGDDCCGTNRRMNLVERPSDSALGSRISMRFRGFLHRKLCGCSKAYAFAPLYPLSHRIRVLLGEEIGTDIVNGFGVSFGFPGQKKCEKMVVAVDVDEVLGSFLSALNKFIGHRYSLNLKVSEYYVYEFFRIWGCSRVEADMRVHEFFKSPYFKSGIDPIPGAQTVLRNLSSFCDLSVVTSRQNVIEEHTLEWIQMHYPGMFKEIHFGNHFALDGKSRPKSDICKSLGAQVLIDDNPRYALECADVGIRVLLFDYYNSYPWSKDSSTGSHSLVTKVHSWEEVEQHLVSWATFME